MHEAFRLGASLYVPATHPKLLGALTGHHFPGVRSLIACTEDSLSDDDLAAGLDALAALLPRLPGRQVGPLRFIRPRNAQVLAELLAMPGIDRVHGFVIPKADQSTFGAYDALLGPRDFWVMPTLETCAVFDPTDLADLRRLFQSCATQRHILALRIGGNDLLRMLGLKRSRGVTLYQTPLGLLTQQLVLAFRPFGFQLTAPVYDFVDDPVTLRAEAAQDVLQGLVGKTAIHPAQVPVIDAVLSVCERDLEAARLLLDEDRAVFKHDGGMLERSVHLPWARALLERARQSTPGLHAAGADSAMSV